MPINEHNKGGSIDSLLLMQPVQSSRLILEVIEEEEQLEKKQQEKPLLLSASASESVSQNIIKTKMEIQNCETELKKLAGQIEIEKNSIKNAPSSKKILGAFFLLGHNRELGMLPVLGGGVVFGALAGWILSLLFAVVCIIGGILPIPPIEVFLPPLAIAIGAMVFVTSIICGSNSASRERDSQEQTEHSSRVKLNELQCEQKNLLDLKQKHQNSLLPTKKSVIPVSSTVSVDISAALFNSSTSQQKAEGTEESHKVFQKSLAIS